MTYVIDSFLFLHNSALFACQANVDVSKLSDGKSTRTSKTQSDFFLLIKFIIQEISQNLDNPLRPLSHFVTLPHYFHM